MSFGFGNKPEPFVVGETVLINRAGEYNGKKATIHSITKSGTYRLTLTGSYKPIEESSLYVAFQASELVKLPETWMH